jgi:hypothetical protein
MHSLTFCIVSQVEQVLELPISIFGGVGIMGFFWVLLLKIWEHMLGTVSSLDRQCSVIPLAQKFCDQHLKI